MSGYVRCALIYCLREYERVRCSTLLDAVALGGVGGGGPRFPTMSACSSFAPPMRWQAIVAVVASSAIIVMAEVSAHQTHNT